MNKLSAERFSKARDFIVERARPLEKALYRFHFESGAKEDVVHEVRAYQNADGGFGHALESDLRTPESSVICTVRGVQLLTQIGV